jgi:hypothetical protein
MELVLKTPDDVEVWELVEDTDSELLEDVVSG